MDQNHIARRDVEDKSRKGDITIVKPLEDVLREIGEAIEVVRLSKCESAASLLEMAELELRMKVHNVSEVELTVFCRELEQRYRRNGMTRNGGNVVELRPAQARAVRTRSL